MFSIFDFLTLLAELLQIFGLLVFGVAASWFTLYAFREQIWQLRIAVFLGFFLLAAVISFSISTSGVGAFALGAGAAMLFLGLKEANKSEGDEENEG